jgi:hypothetical protein
LRPVENVPGLENVDVTDKIAGHTSYRTFMPLILDQLGFPVSADHFDEPEEPDFEEDRIVVREGEDVQKKGWFSKNKPAAPNASASRPPSATSVGRRPKDQAENDESLPPREEKTPMTSTATSPSTPRTDKQLDDAIGDAAELPARAGFDLAAMRAIVDGIEQGKGSRHDLTRPTRPEISPPPPSSVMSAKRPQSMSPPITKSPDLTPTTEQRSAMPNPTRSAVSELRSASAEPRSLDDALLPSGSEEDARLPSSSPSLSQPRPTGDLGLSFGGYDGAPWTPVSADKEAYGGGGSGSGFGTPFGNPFHPTPFTAVGQTPSNVSKVAVPGVDRDPWSLQTYSGDVSNSTGAKKPSSVFATNPWES